MNYKGHPVVRAGMVCPRLEQPYLNTPSEVPGAVPSAVDVPGVAHPVGSKRLVKGTGAPMRVIVNQTYIKAILEKYLVGNEVPPNSQQQQPATDQAGKKLAPGQESNVTNPATGRAQQPSGAAGTEPPNSAQTKLAQPQFKMSPPQTKKQPNPWGGKPDQKPTQVVRPGRYVGSLPASPKSSGPEYPMGRPQQGGQGTRFTLPVGVLPSQRQVAGGQVVGGNGPSQPVQYILAHLPADALIKGIPALKIPSPDHKVSSAPTQQKPADAVVNPGSGLPKLMSGGGGYASERLLPSTTTGDIRDRSETPPKVPPKKKKPKQNSEKESAAATHYDKKNLTIFVG